MHAVRRFRRVLGHKFKNIMAVLCDRARHIVQGLAAFETDFRRLSGIHALNQQLGFDESQRTDFGSYINEKISITVLATLFTVRHFYFTTVLL